MHVLLLFCRVSDVSNVVADLDTFGSLFMQYRLDFGFDMEGSRYVTEDDEFTFDMLHFNSLVCTQKDVRFSGKEYKCRSTMIRNTVFAKYLFISLPYRISYPLGVVSTS